MYVPSEIARLVLGYLEETGCIHTAKRMLDESIHLREYAQLLKDGYHYPTTIEGHHLIEIVQDYYHLTHIDAVEDASVYLQEKLGSAFFQLKRLISSKKTDHKLRCPNQLHLNSNRIRKPKTKMILSKNVFNLARVSNDNLHRACNFTRKKGGSLKTNSSINKKLTNMVSAEIQTDTIGSLEKEKNVLYKDASLQVNTLLPRELITVHKDCQVNILPVRNLVETVNRASQTVTNFEEQQKDSLQLGVRYAHHHKNNLNLTVPNGSSLICTTTSGKTTEATRNGGKTVPANEENILSTCQNFTNQITSVSEIVRRNNEATVGSLTGCSILGSPVRSSASPRNFPLHVLECGNEQKTSTPITEAASVPKNLREMVGNFEVGGHLRCGQTSDSSSNTGDCVHTNKQENTSSFLTPNKCLNILAQNLAMTRENNDFLIRAKQKNHERISENSPIDQQISSNSLSPATSVNILTSPSVSSDSSQDHVFFSPSTARVPKSVASVRRNLLTALPDIEKGKTVSENSRSVWDNSRLIAGNSQTSYEITKSQAEEAWKNISSRAKLMEKAHRESNLLNSAIKSPVKTTSDSSINSLASGVNSLNSVCSTLLSKTLISNSNNVLAATSPVQTETITPLNSVEPELPNRFPDVTSPRYELSKQRAKMATAAPLSTPVKDFPAFDSNLYSPKRKSHIPKRRRLSMSPSSSQVNESQTPEKESPVTSVQDDFMDYGLLEELINYPPLIEKLTENINEVVSNKVSGQPTVECMEKEKEPNGIVQDILTRTESDPVFEEVLTMLFDKQDPKSITLQQVSESQVNQEISLIDTEISNTESTTDYDGPKVTVTTSYVETDASQHRNKTNSCNNNTTQFIMNNTEVNRYVNNLEMVPHSETITLTYLGPQAVQSSTSAQMELTSSAGKQVFTTEDLTKSKPNMAPSYSTGEQLSSEQIIYSSSVETMTRCENSSQLVCFSRNGDANNGNAMFVNNSQYGTCVRVLDQPIMSTLGGTITPSYGNTVVVNATAVTPVKIAIPDFHFLTVSPSQLFGMPFTVVEQPTLSPKNSASPKSTSMLVSQGKYSVPNSAKEEIPNSTKGVIAVKSAPTYLDTKDLVPQNNPKKAISGKETRKLEPKAPVTKSEISKQSVNVPKLSTTALQKLTRPKPNLSRSMLSFGNNNRLSMRAKIKHSIMDAPVGNNSAANLDLLANTHVRTLDFGTNSEKLKGAKTFEPPKPSLNMDHHFTSRPGSILKRVVAKSIKDKSISSEGTVSTFVTNIPSMTVSNNQITDPENNIAVDSYYLVQSASAMPPVASAVFTMEIDGSNKLNNIYSVPISIGQMLEQSTTNVGSTSQDNGEIHKNLEVKTSEKKHKKSLKPDPKAVNKDVADTLVSLVECVPSKERKTNSRTAKAKSNKRVHPSGPGNQKSDVSEVSHAKKPAKICLKTMDVDKFLEKIHPRKS